MPECNTLRGNWMADAGQKLEDWRGERDSTSLAVSGIHCQPH
jgi:hypothetical protein